MERISDVPREHRVIAFFAGFGVTVTIANIILVAFIYSTVAACRQCLAGALFFLTPVYFLTSIWASTRDRAGRIAMVFGLAMGPCVPPDRAGVRHSLHRRCGGTLAFLIDRSGKSGAGRNHDRL
jgi:hypothetical protein